MPVIRVRENEPFDVALRRFKRSCEKAGILADVRVVNSTRSRLLFVSALKLLLSSATPRRCPARMRAVLGFTNHAPKV